MRIAVSLHGLARVYWSKGAYDEAEPLHQETVRIKKSLDGLVLLYCAKGACDKAEALHQEALRILGVWSLPFSSCAAAGA